MITLNEHEQSGGADCLRVGGGETHPSGDDGHNAYYHCYHEEAEVASHQI